MCYNIIKGREFYKGRLNKNFMRKKNITKKEEFDPKEMKMHDLWSAVKDARECNFEKLDPRLTLKEMAEIICSALGDEADELSVEISKIYFAKKEEERRKKEQDDYDKKFEEETAEWRRVMIEKPYMRKTIQEFLDLGYILGKKYERYN